MKWKARLTGMAISVILLTGVSLASATGDLETLHQELDSLKAGQHAIQTDLREIKELLKPLQPKPRIEPVDLQMNLEGAPVQGDPHAPLTLVEFSDYECPYCARHVQTTWPQLENAYLRTGKIRHVFRDFPLEAIHTHASKAAEAAHCAGEQGQYWAMHDRLFAHPTALTAEELPKHAEAVGLDLPKFQACLDSGRYAEKVAQSLTDGKAAGVQGTPTFLIGFTNGDATTFTATRRLRGALPFAEFQKAFTDLLAERPAVK